MRSNTLEGLPGQVNIQIMRIYSKLKGIALDNKDILMKLEKLEAKVGKHDKNFQIVFAYLNELLNPNKERLRRIGFKRKGEES